MNRLSVGDTAPDFTHFKPGVFLVDTTGKIIHTNYLTPT